jgi:hypothetical protein
MMHHLDADADDDGVEMHMEMGAGGKGQPMEDAHGLDNAMMHADEHAEAGLLNAELHIDVHALMESEAKEDHGMEVEIEHADEVHTSADFEHFVAHKAKSDEHLTQVGLKGATVEMTYAMPVKFFGFWSTTLDTTARADAGGSVEVDYPWYSIFMSKDFSKKTLAPMMKAEIEAQKSATVAVEATGTTSARTFAAPHVFDAMVTVMAKVKASWNLKENVK